MLLLKFDSNIFNLFSGADCSFLLNCARFFEKLMIKRRISYFKISHSIWSQNRVCEFNCSLTFWMCHVHFCMRSSFETKELWNFHRLKSFLLSKFIEMLKRTKKSWMINWYVHKISESLTTSRKFWEVKMQSSLRWIRPEKYCCLKVYWICFGFITHHILHKFNFCLISSNLLKECFFRLGEPPFASRERSRNKLKSPAKIMRFSLLRSKFDINMFSSLNVWICSLSIFAL